MNRFCYNNLTLLQTTTHSDFIMPQHNWHHPLYLNTESHPHKNLPIPCYSIPLLITFNLNFLHNFILSMLYCFKYTAFLLATQRKPGTTGILQRCGVLKVIKLLLLHHRNKEIYFKPTPNYPVGFSYLIEYEVITS